MSHHLDRAGVLLQQGRYDLVEREAAEAVEEDPGNAVAHAYFALALLYRENGCGAMAAARRAVAAEPELAYGHYVLATILLDRDQLDDALAAITEAVRLAPFDADCLAQQSLIHLARDEVTAAEAAASDGLRRDPCHGGCANARALALVRGGREADAAEAIDRALSLDPNNALAYAIRGCVCAQAGRPAEAGGYFREALRIDPRNRVARQGLMDALRMRTWPRRMLLRGSRGLDGIFHAQPLRLLLLATLWFALARQTAEATPVLWPIVVALYAALFFARTAGSVFRVGFLFDAAEKSLVSRDERTAAAWYGALTGGGILFAAVGAGQPSDILRAAAFACIVLAGTVDHLDPRSRRDARRAAQFAAQALRIGGMSALLIGYYVCGVVVFVTGVAAYHWVEGRRRPEFEI
jgi:tetratricopeptide (TPR) repeat protein